MKTLLIIAALVGLVAGAHASRADDVLTSADMFPVGEAYRNLFMVKLLARGADQLLTHHLGGFRPRQGNQQMSAFLDLAENPVARIADPETMLFGTGQLVQLGMRSAKAIEQELGRIERNNPRIILGVGKMSLYEDAILLRMAISEAIEMHGAERVAESLASYAVSTEGIRNDMETEQLSLQLAALTTEYSDVLKEQHKALSDALQDEMDPFSVGEAVSRIKRMNRASREEAAVKSSQQLYQNVLLMSLSGLIPGTGP
jgi:hypothetical protein